MARASTIYMLPEFLLQKLFIPLTCLFYCIMTVTCVIPNSKLSQRRLPNEIQLRQLDLPCAWSSTGPLCDNTSQVWRANATGRWFLFETTGWIWMGLYVLVCDIYSLILNDKGRSWLSWAICCSHNGRPQNNHKTTTALNHNEDKPISLLLTAKAPDIKVLTAGTGLYLSLAKHNRWPVLGKKG